jgi:hypothetical protein
MKRLLLRLLGCALLPLVLFVACDSGGSNGVDLDNEFSFSITPVSSSGSAVAKVSEKDLNGYSFFVDANDVDDVDDEAFVVYFSGNENFSQQNATQGLFGFVARNSGQPGTGDFDITDGADGTASSSDFVGWLYEDLGDTQNAPYYLIQNGTLSLSTSNDDEVTGQLSGTATAYTFTSTGITTDTVEVSGSFTAEDLNTYVPFNNYTDTP